MLAAALEALERGDDAAALTALVEAWRGVRHPRIADLVDRVSARIGAPPVAGKTVKARTAAWIALAKQARTVDVGALVATPWPGTWQAAEPLVELAIALPPDPRVAKALASLVDDPRFESRHAKHLRERVGAAVRELVPIDPPALSAADTKLLARIEACFADEVRSERSATKGREELLAAIYAHPADDAARSVYADWLTEQGDPQGEFIALQLARHRGERGDRKRERALVKKHGARWVGAIEPAIAETGRVFERGFLAEAVLASAVALDEPAWATVHTIRIGPALQYQPETTEILCRPAFAHVARWQRVGEAHVVRLVERGHPMPAVVELEVALHDYMPAEQRPRFFDGVTFPNLRRVALETHAPEAVHVMLDAARGLEHVVFLPTQLYRGRVDRLGVIGALAASWSIPEVAVEVSDWRFTLRRDAAGRRSILHAAPYASVRPEAFVLASALDTFEPSTLTAIEVAAFDDLPAFTDGETDIVEQALQRFTEASISVPWQRTQLVDDIPVSCTVTGVGDIDADWLRAVWAHVTSFGAVFDSMMINGGKSVEIDGSAAPLAALAKKKTQSLWLHRRGHCDVLGVGHGTSLTAVVPFRAGEEFVDRYVAFLAKLDTFGSGRYPPKVAFVEAATGGYAEIKQHDLDPLRREMSWVMLVSERELPLDEIERIPEHVPWVRTRRCGKQVALILGDRPTALPTDEQRKTLARALTEIAWRAWGKRHGYVPPALVSEAIEPLLAGFTRTGELADGRCWYKKDGAEIVVSTNGPLDVVQVSLRVAAGDFRKVRYALTEDSTTLAKARRELAAFLTAFEADLEQVAT